MRNAWIFATCTLLAAPGVHAEVTAGAKPADAVYWGTETREAQHLALQYAAKQGTMGRSPHAMVAACHTRSVDIGLRILQRGGNAVDAFIAVTFADYVQAPGTSSLGGPLGALVYDARSRKVESLIAPLRTVRDPAGQWTVGETVLAKQVLIPGAVAGLELLHRQRGKLPWRDLVEPARALAAEGFVVDALYAGIVANYRAVATRSDYGRATFLHADGTPLAAGEILKLPVLAETLAQVGKHGAHYFYRGAWAAHAVREIAAQGGKIAAHDFVEYRARIDAPLRTEYRGQRLFALNTSNSGGLRLLLALRALEHADLAKLGHYSETLDGLEVMLRTVSAVNAESPLYSHDFFADARNAQALLNGDRGREIWNSVQARGATQPIAPAGSHSYSVVVVDAAGNAVAGTHTIESLPFGSGIFVDGVPLNNTGLFHPWQAGNPASTPPASYVVEPFTATFAFRGSQLVLATSAFSSGLWPADLQTVVSALDFGWTPERIALTPRFGTYALDLVKLVADPTTTLLDKRFNATVIEKMMTRGIKLSQAGYVDTGMIVAVTRAANGDLMGFTPEQLPDGKASGY